MELAILCISTHWLWFAIPYILENNKPPKIFKSHGHMKKAQNTFGFILFDIVWGLAALNIGFAPSWNPTLFKGLINSASDNLGCNYV